MGAHWLVTWSLRLTGVYLHRTVTLRRKPYVPASVGAKTSNPLTLPRRIGQVIFEVVDAWCGVPNGPFLSPVCPGPKAQKGGWLSGGTEGFPFSPAGAFTEYYSEHQE